MRTDLHSVALPLPRNLFYTRQEWRTDFRVIIGALAAAALLAVYGATAKWGAAPASIVAALLLAACVLAEVDLIRRLARRLDDLSSDLDGRLTALAEESVVVQEALKDEVGALRGEKYIRFSRRLSQEAEVDLCSTWSDRLGVAIEPPYVRYLERKFLQIEGVCVGRLAGHMHDALLRAVVARSVEGPEFSGVEIGVLFGISAMVIQEAVSPFFERSHMTLIDPLEGYYRPGELDPMTKLPVSRRLLQRNLDRLCVPPEQYTVIQGYSTDDAVLERVSRQTYNFLLIDGDHSFEGVKGDFDRYAPLLRKGGYLVIDDYRAKPWPGVTRFVDEVLSASPRFESVGMSSHTAVYRRT